MIDKIERLEYETEAVLGTLATAINILLEDLPCSSKSLGQSLIASEILLGGHIQTLNELLAELRG